MQYSSSLHLLLAGRTLQGNIFHEKENHDVMILTKLLPFNKAIKILHLSYQSRVRSSKLLVNGIVWNEILIYFSNF